MERSLDLLPDNAASGTASTADELDHPGPAFPNMHSEFLRQDDL